MYSTSVYVVGYDQVLGQGDGRWVIQKRSRTTGGLIWQKTSNPTTGNDVATEVAVDSSGIYIVGYQWRIEKRNQTTGNLIWAKGTTISRSASGVAVDSSGVYIVGDDSSLSYSNLQWRIEKRSKTTGSVIWSKTSNPTGGADHANGVAVDSTGVYIVGVQPGGYSGSQWRIEKRSLTTGSLIWYKIGSGTIGGEATDVAVDGTGVYIVGPDGSLIHGDSNWQWRIEKRSKTTGSVIWSKTSNPTNYPDMPWGVAVSSTGVYIVGYQNVAWGDKAWRIERRSLTTGSLVWSRTSNPTSGYGAYDWPWDVAVDSTGVYIVGYYNWPSNEGWRIEKRQL